MNSELDVIVIGAGHAGLSVSYQLKKMDLNHLVLEKDQIGHTWLSQRWDSFRFNTPNSFNLLPGQDTPFADKESFCSAAEFVSFLEKYARENALPVREHSEVLSITKPGGSRMFEICVIQEGIRKYFSSRQVIVASGGQNKKIVPSFGERLSPSILQLHSCDYKNPSGLPEGGVLMIGCAQSGIQIAEELLNSGRKVYISTCKVGRLPRRYRGKDILEWLFPMGFFDTMTETITDPKIFLTRQPHISGVGLRGHTLSLQSLARSGATIFGKVSGAEEYTLSFQNDAAENVNFADEFSRKTKAIIDLYISRYNLTAPPPEEDPADIPDASMNISGAADLNLKENNIHSIIWATGYTGDFSFLHLPVFDEDHILKHKNGIAAVEGLYFLGLPWMRRRKSGIVYGIKDDAEFIAKEAEAYHKSFVSTLT